MWQNQPTEADIAADKVKKGLVIQDAKKKLKQGEKS
jgi:YidC/Oxa1 family membrane protein insertase